jgi:hypothetical protein
MPRKLEHVESIFSLTHTHINHLTACYCLLDGG